MIPFAKNAERKTTVLFFDHSIYINFVINQAPRNHRRDHPEQAARDCWLELKAAVTLNSKLQLG